MAKKSCTVFRTVPRRLANEYLYLSRVAPSLIKPLRLPPTYDVDKPKAQSHSPLFRRHRQPIQRRGQLPRLIFHPTQQS